MIKIEELRIGNIVSLSVSKYYKNGYRADPDCIEVVITDIEKKYYSNLKKDKYIISGHDPVDGETYYLGLDDIIPVSLTEEVLLEYGFKSMEYPVADGGRLYGYEISSCRYFLLKYNPLDPTYFVEYNFEQPIKFLHQLQNIIMDLTGK